MLGLGAFLYVIFISVAWIMTIYSLNFYYLSYQSQHNTIHQKRKGRITVQVDSKIGLVQCRWGHLNENYSSLTEAQAFSLDIHFLIEQKAKSLTHLFMNFNGAAGIWRTSCIVDAGGWHATTLVEDLDLSYRAQLKGWKSLFLENIVVEGELPVQMNAAKRQQFRWAKGSIQVASKLLIDILL